MIIIYSCWQAGIVVSFGRWLMVAVPFALLCTIIAWLLLIMSLNPDDISSVPVIVFERNQQVFNRRNVAVLSLSLLTIILFATSSLTADIFGDISVISLLFVTVMFGSGMLTEVSQR